MRVLFAHGAKINTISEYSYTVESIISGMDYYLKPGRMFRWARDQGGDKDYVGVIKEFIRHGGDVNGTRTSGETMLMAACRVGNVQAVRLLLKYKANINLKDHRSRTAASYVPFGRNDILQLLSRSGNRTN